MRLRPRYLFHFAPIAIAAVFVGACSELGGLFGAGEEPEKARAQAESATVWELTLNTGRYGVMLDQARTILKLPEPTAAGPDAPPVAGESVAERQALAAQQVQVANEFYADAARACAKKRIPEKLRAMACQHRAGVPVELRQPAPLDVAALSARNEALSNVVMPWWDAACATVPKPRGEDVEPACPME